MSTGPFYQGHCYCGEIEFHVDGSVAPNKALYCHCESCRRAHASPLYQIVYIPAHAFTVTKGSQLLKQYARNELSVNRAFCSQCGSRVMNTLPNRNDLGVGFFPALLDEDTQHALPEMYKPRYHNLSHESVLDLGCIVDRLERK